MCAAGIFARRTREKRRRGVKSVQKPSDPTLNPGRTLFPGVKISRTPIFTIYQFIMNDAHDSAPKEPSRLDLAIPRVAGLRSPSARGSIAVMAGVQEGDRMKGATVPDGRETAARAARVQWRPFTPPPTRAGVAARIAPV